MKCRLSTVKLTVLAAIVLAAFVIPDAGCGGRSGAVVASTNSSGAGALSSLPVITFSANPAEIKSGQSATLTWTVARALTVSIDQGIGKVSANGTRIIVPAATTTYTLTAAGTANTTNAKTTVTVMPSGLPFINSFTVNPNVISIGQPALLQWNIAGANSVYINQGILDVPASGSRIIAPAATTKYTLTATNNYGSIVATVTATVSTTRLPVITTFTANRTGSYSGQPVGLQWKVTGADFITINQGIGTVPSSGSIVVNPKVTTSYTLTAENVTGSISQTVTVTAGTPLPKITFTASPAIINPGQPVTLQWSVTDATNISINPGSTVSPAGTLIVNPASTTLYILTASNSAGTASSSAQVTVR